MKLVSPIFYYLMVTFGLAFSCIQYANEHIPKACFSLIGVGILLVLNEVKRNARITTNYNHCEFITAAAPQPEPAAPATEKKEPDHERTGLRG